MNNSLNAIIVEDEAMLAHGLNSNLGTLCPSVKVLRICFTAEDAIEQLQLLKPDLVFLDISLPKKNAFEMLAELPEINFDIIFTTAHESYSIKAFKYNAVDYLLKPIDEDELVKAVNRAAARRERSTNVFNIEALLSSWKAHQFEKQDKICLPVINGFQIIETADIIYCEAANSYTVFHLNGNTKVVASKPLADYSALLEQTHFFRVHKSYLVNLNRMRGYTKGEGGVVIMSNGEEIEVSRRKKNEFLLKVNNLYKA